MVYDFPVVDEKVKPHQVTTLHMICALSFIVAGMIMAVYNFDVLRWWGLAILSAGVSLTVVVMARNRWVISHRINPVFRTIELLVSIAIASYSVLQKWKFPAGIFGVLSAAIIFAIFWEQTAGKPASIHIDETGIKLPPASRKRFWLWAEVEEVILRFGILTINYADNSLMQWTVSGPETDNEIFEAWCSARVEENRKERVNDDW